MQNLNVTIGQTLFIGDDFAGVLVRPEIREGRVVFVEAAPRGYMVGDTAVAGLTAIREGEVFWIENNGYMVFGYDEEDGRPEIGLAPRSMVG